MKAPVVPLAGDVDRNLNASDKEKADTLSSPSRGTWIEISRRRTDSPPAWSSPSRGTWIEICALGNSVKVVYRRPPRGGRG